MVLPEISTLFSLNINEHVKWLIYTTMWKTCFNIDTNLKEELENKALFFKTLLEYKSKFNPNEEFSEDINLVDLDNNTRLVNVVNETHYLNAMMFDMQIVLKEKVLCGVLDETVVGIFLPFSYSMYDRINDEVDDFFEVLTVDLHVLDEISDKKKLKLLFLFWNKLIKDEQNTFLKKISGDIQIFHPFDNPVSLL